MSSKMITRRIVFVAMAAALLAGGLAGCRSSRRPAQAQPQAAQPAPQTTYPSYGPSQAPTTVTQVPSRPPPPSGPMVSPQPGASRVISRVPVPAPSLSGSPDGSSMGAPSAFPPSMPTAPAIVRTDPTPVIHDGASTTAEVDNRIDVLQQQIAALKNKLETPVVAEVDAGPALAVGGQEDARAAAFASTLRSRISGEVVHTGNVVVVRLEDAFRSGSDTLKKDPSLVATLLHTAEALQSAGPREVLVVGHTDSDPIKRSKWPSNKALSEARAQRVAAELSRRGVPAGALEVIGEGASQPLVPDNTKANKAKNRRVEVHVRF